MIVWRISDHATLDGAGGLIVAGRWHSRGRPVVYMAESSALAVLEVLVHLEVARVPATFQLMRIEVPDALRWSEPGIEKIDDPAACRAWGDAWLASGATALAKVPSRVAPGAFNWLLNPIHPDAAQVRITGSARHPWDARLFRG